MKFYLLMVLMIPFFLVPSNVSAQEDIKCPDKIAMIPNDILTRVVLQYIQRLYSDLKCQVDFIELPGRRGVKSFNNGYVDGELFRLAIIEPSYKRDFIRSSVPLFYLSNSLWVHADENKRERFPYGYILGVKWQEDFDGYENMRRFSNIEEMFKAYTAGHLAGFLASDFSVKLKISSGELLPEPIVEKKWLEAPFYHYLGAEFAPFMARISGLLNTRGPLQVAVEDFQ